MQSPKCLYHDIEAIDTVLVALTNMDSAMAVHKGTLVPVLCSQMVNNVEDLEHETEFNDNHG